MQPFEIILVKRPTPLPEAKISTPAQAANYIRQNIIPAEEWKESCYAMTLDRTGNLIGIYHVSSGSSDKTVFDRKAIVKATLDTMCRQVVIVHNHPQGDPRPSQSDIRETEHIRTALAAFDSTLADHIILGEKNFFSFQEERILNYV